MVTKHGNGTVATVPVNLANGRPAPKIRVIRCGWCGTGHHDGCRVKLKMTNGLWTCGCECVEREHKTRCTRCGRRDQPVTNHDSSCIDVEGCYNYVEQRRRSNPQWLALQAVTQLKEKRMSAATEEKVAKAPKTGECRCCGGTTKGGDFLPGHDARFVSEQAVAYLNAESDDDADLIAEDMSHLSAALNKKFVARVEKLRSEADAKIAREARKAEEARAKADAAEQKKQAKKAKADADAADLADDAEGE